MEDQQAWNLGTEKLKGILTTISAGDQSALSILLSSYQQTKETIASVATEVDSLSVCRECGGQCCMNGKYRINVLDYLALVATETSISVDFFQKPLCPYSSHTGCSMKSGLRPADCALFLCDAIDSHLLPEARRALLELEETLREVIAKASRLTGESVGTPLLLWAEKSCI